MVQQTGGAGGDRLVVGGGHAFGQAQGDVSLNIDPNALPDHVGDIRNAPFLDQTFAEVYFERMPFDMFTGQNVQGLDEAARVLRSGGSLVIETGSSAPFEAVVTRLTQLGFEHIIAGEVTGVGVFRGLRIRATKGGT